MLLIKKVIVLSYVTSLQVFQLKVDGVAFRFVPDSSQVANAIKVRAR